MNDAPCGRVLVKIDFNRAIESLLIKVTHKTGHEDIIHAIYAAEITQNDKIENYLDIFLR